ncbi:MAG: Uma2 family endonuclease [Aridibacter sp.]
MSAVLDRPKTIAAKTRQSKKVEKQKVVEKVVLRNISWETYESLLEEQAEKSSVHFYYNNGDLEIMVESYKHGRYSSILSELVIEIAAKLEIDSVGAGSTTFKREKKQKGFEGDASYYFKNAELVRAKDEIDLSKDPSPELVLEIDITHGSLSKFPIFAGLGVEEIWRFDGEEVLFYRLENEDYKEVSESICLKGVKSETVTELLFAAQEMKRFEWVKLIHKTIEGK